MGLARVANELPMAASPACAQKSSLQNVRGPTKKCAIYVTQALTLLAERLGWILSRVMKEMRVGIGVDGIGVVNATGV